MAVYLKQNETVAKSIERICKEQIDKAIDEIDDTAPTREKTVHQIRKRCKKLRGVIRLVAITTASMSADRTGSFNPHNQNPHNS